MININTFRGDLSSISAIATLLHITSIAMNVCRTIRYIHILRARIFKIKCLLDIHPNLLLFIIEMIAFWGGLNNTIIYGCKHPHVSDR